MSAQESAAALRRAVEEAFSHGRLETLREMSSPDVVTHDPAEPEEVRGIEAHMEQVRAYRTAMPDLEVTIEDVIAAEDKVVFRWSARGTNDGELLGMPPTGRHVEFTGTTIQRLDEEGKVVEIWDQWDNAGFLSQLGVSPQAAAQSA